MTWIKYLIAMLGGFQFGYAVGVMSGAVLFITSQFFLTPEQQGWVVSAFLLGTLPATAVAGYVIDWLGRKKIQQLIAVLFLLGTLILIMAKSIEMIYIGRILQGIAAGGISVAGPMYLAEISPPEKRGTYIGWYQLAVTLGIFFSYAITLALAPWKAWRWMFGLAAIPAVVHFFGFISLPDSHATQAEKSKASWKAFFLEPRIRTALTWIILINVFQQITGVNAILYFAPLIFQASGFTDPAMALLPPIFMGIINFTMTGVAAYFIDRAGRRPLLLIGISGMTIALAGLSWAFLSGGVLMQWLVTISIMIFTASFALGLGPIPQLLGPELLPRKVRAQGVSIGMISSWIFNFIVVFTFMECTTRFSHAGTFAIYAFFGLLALYFVWRHVPETKGTLID